MFEVGEKVKVNLGGKNGTLPGRIYDIREAGKVIFVQLDNGSTAMLDPWDVVALAEETE